MTVLAYEPVANHGTGSNVLYADGTVTFMVEPNASRVIQQVAAGQNPPKLGPAMAPATLPVEVE
jgi:prepilin-type processing-associated H-X9-DG protein